MEQTKAEPNRFEEPKPTAGIRIDLNKKQKYNKSESN